jgi:histone deacetylase HOS3
METVCPGSLYAIQGAIGTVCEAVDTVVQGARDVPAQGVSRAFCLVRPPGHHCGEDTPSGFCFVNNVVIGAAHGDYLTGKSGSTYLLMWHCVSN